MSGWNWAAAVIGTTLIAEVVFYVFYRIELKKKQKVSPVRKTTKFAEHKRKSFIVNLCNALEDIMEDNDSSKAAEQFITGWFHHCSFDQVKRKNVEDFVSRNFFNNLLHHLEEDEMQLVDDYVEALERVLGRRLPEGRNSSIQCMVAAEDTVLAIYHPFVWYVTCFVVAKICSFSLYMNGFTYMHAGGVRYWHRPARIAPEKTPVVFFHGLGVGIFPYLWFLLRIHDRDLFLIEFPWVAMRFGEEVPEPRRIALDIEIALHNHGFEKACFVAHSYGSFVLGYVDCFAKDLIDSAVLLDPPAILLALPDVCSNFLHLRPIHKPHIRSSFRPETICYKTKLNWKERIEFYCRHASLYWFSREIGNAVTLSRHLWWYHANLFAEDLPAKTTVLLSSDDSIIPVDEVHLYLQRYNRRSKDKHINFIWMDQTVHGGFLMSQKTQTQILECINEHH